MATTSTFVTIRDAARRLGVHENTVRRYVDRGLIRAERLPSGVRRLRAEDVQRLTLRTDSVVTSSGDADIDALILATGAQPIVDVRERARPDIWESDEEVERFIEFTRDERDRDR